MMKRRTYKLPIAQAAFLIGTVYFCMHRMPFSNRYITSPSASHQPPAKQHQPPTVPVLVPDNSIEMVVASTSKENVTWLYDHLLDWPKNIYVVDDATAKLTVPQNKGREAMAFLTYGPQPKMAQCP